MYTWQFYSNTAITLWSAHVWQPQNNRRGEKDKESISTWKMKMGRQGFIQFVLLFYCWLTVHQNISAG